MASEKRSVAGSGVGVLGLLGVAFVVLKLCGVIQWEWWVVLLPFWGPVAVALVIVIAVFLIALVASVAASLLEKKARDKGYKRWD